jgi:hypothetical protein
VEEKKIKAFFKEQVRAILERSATEPDGFRAYFADRQPKDEEILGLLAIMVMTNGHFPLGDRFPTPVEALAALSNSSRAEICREFRKELKTCLRQLTPA